MSRAIGPRRRNSEAATAAALVASNCTINRFLGCKRKDWMTGLPENSTCSSTITPTGNPQAPLHATMKSNATHKANDVNTTSKAVRQPLSTSTSPQLANAAKTRSTAITDEYMPINVLPSPAPSEDERANNNSIDLDGYDQGQRQALYNVARTSGLHADKHARDSGADGANKRLRRHPTSISQQGLVTAGADAFLNPDYNLSLITAYVGSVGVAGAQSGGERLRIDLLKEACTRCDYEYITMHQLLCLSTISPQRLPPIIKQLPNAAAFWDLLNQLLVSNEQFPLRFLRWAAYFPYPVTLLADRLPAFAKALSECVTVMQLAPSQWAMFSQQCSARKYPPLCREIVACLGISSVVLQRVVFTAIRRSFWGEEEDIFVLRAEEFFRSNQTDYIAQPQQQQFPLSTNPHAESAEDYSLAQQYYTLFLNHLQWQRPRLPITSSSARPFQGRSLAAQMHQQQQHQHQARPPGPQTETGLASQLHVPLSQRDRNPYVMASGTPAYSIQQLRHDSSVTPRQLRFLAPNTQNPMSASSSHRRSSAPDADNTGREHNPQSQLPMSTSRSGRLSFRGGGVTQGHHPPLTGGFSGPPQQSNPQNQPGQPLLPPLGYRASQPAQADPLTFATHQAYLRSPMLGSLLDTNLTKPSERLYQCVNGFSMVPQRFDHATIISEWSFRVSATAAAAIPRDTPCETGQPPLRLLNVSHRTYRLRCVKLPALVDITGESPWVMMDTYWPPNMYFEINSVKLQPRRKLHHGKDLPVDVSQYIASGINVVRMFHNKSSTDQRSEMYACAVEAVDVLSHEHIRTMCISEALVPAPDVLQSIKCSLSATNDDEDLVLVDSNVTIKLCDPFSGCKIFDVPARGKNCKHRECFDLETFLATRKSTKPNWPTVVDCWRCPICGGDVRPHELIVDGFLSEVRASLAQQGLLNTRAIVVESDGSWKPRVEKKDDNNDRTRGDTSRGASCSTGAQTNLPATVVEREVIDLQD